MDALSLLRTMGALGIVLGMLAGALWAVRRFNIKLPGRIGGQDDRRLAIVERVAIDAKRSVALIRRDAQEHLVLLSPEGVLLIETPVAAPAASPSRDATLAERPAEPPPAWRRHRFPAFDGAPALRARPIVIHDA